MDVKVGDVVRYTGAGLGPFKPRGIWAKRLEVALPYVVTRLRPYEGGQVDATCHELVTAYHPPGEYQPDEFAVGVANLEVVHSTTWTP